MSPDPGAFDSASLPEVVARLERVARGLESQGLELDARLRELRSLILEARPGPHQRLFDLGETAKQLGVSSKTISKMVASGDLRTVSIRSKRLVPIEEIDRASRQPTMKSSGAIFKRTRYDAAAASRELAELRRR